MTGAIVSLAGVEKQYGAATPLRVGDLHLRAGERIALAGVDTAAAEMLVHLITGAALPDAGEVSIFGQSTRGIATDTDWLLSLDRFGLISNRAVLLDQSTIAQNLALPITLSIDPMDPSVRADVERLADLAGVARDRLDQPAGSMTPLERMRVHLARALAASPAALLLEHPTAPLGADGAAFGAAVRAAADARDLAVLAITDDAAFARRCGAALWRLDPASGAVRRGSFLKRWFS